MRPPRGTADAKGMAFRGKRLVLYLLGAGVFCGATTGLLVTPVAYSAPVRARVTAMAPLNAQVLRGVNSVRRAHGLVPLTISSRLGAAAASHSRSMVANGYFAHSSADGSVFWKRIERFYPIGAYRYWDVGENLVWTSPALGAGRAMQMWMNSPEHRKNLLNPRWRQIGVSAVHSPSAPGAYKDLAVTIVTADFGVRS
jgi:uncharacterized protein YkwD